MLADEGKGRADHRLADAQPTRNALRQRGFARAQLPPQPDDVPRLKHLSQGFPKLARMFRAMRAYPKAHGSA